MSFCAHCPHFSYEHEDDGRCLVQYGAFGDSFLEAKQSWETCFCPGFEAEAYA